MPFSSLLVVTVLLMALTSLAQVTYNRTYPLVPSQDTYIHGMSTALFRLDFVEVGHDSLQSRTLLQFDLAEFAQRIRWGSAADFPNLNRSAILGATLRLSCVSVLDGGNVRTNVFRGTVYASQILRPWEQEGVSWTRRNLQGGVWEVRGLDTSGFDAAVPFAQQDVSIGYSTCHSEAALAFDISPGLLESWLEEPASFHGILVWADLPSGAETILKLASTENGLIEKHPKLIVLLQDTIIDSGVSCPGAEFQCVDGSCVSQSKVCNFVDDCLHGNDEDTCSTKCDFEEECLWEAPLVNQMPGWQVHSGSTATSNTGPSGGQSDTGSDVTSRYLYVDASGIGTGILSHFVSPSYVESGPRCTLHFFHHMYGSDVGALRVILSLPGQNWTIWEKTGNQENRWTGDVLSLGRIKEPFHIIFEAERGDGVGDAGDIALDSLELLECSPELMAETCPASQFQCLNLVCLPPNELCNLQKDCLFGEDEAEEQCGVIPFGGSCSFETGWCGWRNVLEEDDFNWTRHNGSTLSPGTGPSADHTLGTDQGFYIYTEVSPISIGNKAFFRSVWFPPPPPATYDADSPHYRTCKVQFFYHMYGTDIGRLQLFAIHNTSTEVSNQLFNEWAQSMDMWQSVVTYLPTITVSYYLQFESVRGLGYKGDIALDDISLSRQCFQLDNLIHSETTPGPTTATETTQGTQVSETVSSSSTLAATDDAPVLHFGTCGSKGREGPTQTECYVAYRLENISVTVSGGIQGWRVPATKTYSLRVVGAGGGTGVENTRPSRGAELQASFQLMAGDQLLILVGQRGQDACDDDDDAPDFGPRGFCNRQLTDKDRAQFGVGGNQAGGGGGGGGGSFVAKVDASSGEYVPLLIAGGGGGQSFSPGPTLDGIHGSVDAPGPGVSGEQGSSYDGSGAGGGWNGTRGNASQVSGMSFLQGGLGGRECYQARHETYWRTLGGFGGGGGACTSGGGGGGYTGGDAPLIKDLYGSGGGGASFVHPSGFNVQKQAGTNLGAGKVVIMAVTVCKDGAKLNEATNICVAASAMYLDAIAGALSAVIVIIFIIVVIAIVYRRKKTKEANAKLVTADYQLNQLRHNALVDFNPCYQLGDGAATVNDLMEVPRENLKLFKALGQGAFGEVYHGLFQASDSKEATEVAVKTLPERSTEQDESDFLMEALIMGNFDHANIVSLRGVCFTQAPRFILLEFMAGGELKQFLRDSRPRRGQPSSLDMSDLLLAAHDVTKGCQYLESRRFIHRDIAARNILLSCKEKGRVAKIGDFGMARDIYRSEYYKKGGQAMLPVKWMPPEAFLDGIFTSKTDVWSFGVLLWEIMSLGYMPYPGMSNQEVIFFMTQGQRMNAPRNCPRPIQELMTQCWQQDPEDRPNFTTIMQFIADCLQNQSILNAPLPQEMLDEGRPPSVTRPRNSKTSPVLTVHGSGGRFFDTGGAHSTVGQGVTSPDEEGEAYLTPDWIPGGRMKKQLLMDDGNVNNSSADCLGAHGGMPWPEPEGPSHESVDKLKRRCRGKESREPRPDSDTSFDPPINQDDRATECTDFLDRGGGDVDETSFTRSSTPRSSSRPIVPSHGRPADDSWPDHIPPLALDTCHDQCRNSRTEEPTSDSGRETVPHGSDDQTTSSSSFSPRILNHIRLPTFARHRSLEGPSSQSASSTPLPMLNRMQSLPVSPNPYTMTDLSSQSGPARGTSGNNGGVFLGTNGADEAARRRVMFNSQSGQVVFEDGEPNGALV